MGRALFYFPVSPCQGHYPNGWGAGQGQLIGRPSELVLIALPRTRSVVAKLLLRGGEVLDAAGEARELEIVGLRSSVLEPLVDS